MSDQVVDTETALEFMKETLERVDPAELAKISTEVEAKSRRNQQALGQPVLTDLSRDGLEEVVREIFSVRRKATKIIDQYGHETLRMWIGELLRGTDETGVRFQTFVDRLDGLDGNLRTDFASELLHFGRPESYWLWTRWMWDPRTRTGALPLVTTVATDLTGDSDGETYVKVGRGVAFVHEVGKAAGFQAIASNIFGTDVFLSCVYVVYAYTVLKMRMTQEFNKVMPGLPEFSRRLLGVNQRGPRKVTSQAH